MFYDFIVAFLCLLLAFKFYHGKLDWLVFWYGCAGDKRKATMPGKRVMRIAWITMLILGLWFILAAVLRMFNQTILENVFRIIGALFFLLSCWYNYEVCYNKLIVKEWL